LIEIPPGLKAKKIVLFGYMHQINAHTLGANILENEE